MTTSAIYKSIGEALIHARRLGMIEDVKTFSTLKGEIELAAKGKGQILDDTLVIKTITSFQKNILKTKAVITDPVQIAKLNHESELYAKFLPQTAPSVPESEVVEQLRQQVALGLNKGALIGWAKKTFPGNDVPALVQLVNRTLSE